jgi:phage shock protein PspC (stress-responsive transcriptional regulator)
MNTTIADGGSATVTDQPDARELRRSSDDKMLAGVAGGIARYLSADVTLARVIIVALVLGAPVPVGGLAGKAHPNRSIWHASELLWAARRTADCSTKHPSPRLGCVYSTRVLFSRERPAFGCLPGASRCGRDRHAQTVRMAPDATTGVPWPWRLEIGTVKTRSGPTHQAMARSHGNG